MNDEKSTSEKAEQALRASLTAIREIGNNGRLSANETTARNVLHEELGYFGTWDGASYHLDESTRDRLIAHARQDASYAAINAAAAMEIAETAVRLMWRLAILMVLCTAAILGVIFLTTRSG